jgi:ABC-type branched-chain amino acid transport systems, ATPase component
VSEVGASPALLQIRDLTKRFGGVTAVNGLSLDVEGGKITGLIGPNGSGKTTLFNLITGFARPDSGSVTFEGQPITGLPPDQINRRGIGRTFQLARIFPRLTVFENMLVPVSETGLRAILAGINNHSEADRANDMLRFLGIEALANQPAGRLSYGQRKLLEFGSVLMSRPSLTMLDEPAGGVNPARLAFIGDHIRELNSQGMTFLVVDHNMPFVMELCHSVAVVDVGRLIANGSPDEVRANPAVLDAYLGN